MKNKRVLLVQGGTSSEREISLRSGRACFKALKQLKHKVIVFDPAKEHFSKNELVDHLEAAKIQTRSYFTGNALFHPAYVDEAKKYKDPRNDFPNVE